MLMTWLSAVAPLPPRQCCRQRWRTWCIRQRWAWARSEGGLNHSLVQGQAGGSLSGGQKEWGVRRRERAWGS